MALLALLWMNGWLDICFIRVRMMDMIWADGWGSRHRTSTTNNCFFYGIPFLPPVFRLQFFVYLAQSCRRRFTFILGNTTNAVQLAPRKHEVDTWSLGSLAPALSSRSARSTTMHAPVSLREQQNINKANSFFPKRFSKSSIPNSITCPKF